MQFPSPVMKATLYMDLTLLLVVKMEIGHQAWILCVLMVRTIKESVLFSTNMAST